MADQAPAHGVDLFAWMRTVRDSDLPARAKLGAYTLVLFADKDGSNCYPALPTIGRAMGSTSEQRARDLARRAIRDLAAAGLLSVGRRADAPDRRYASNLYQFHLPSRPRATATPDDLDDPSRPRATATPDDLDDPSRPRATATPDDLQTTRHSVSDHAPQRLRPRAHATQPTHDLHKTYPPAGGGQILTEEEDAALRSRYGGAVVDAALADFHHRITDGKKIDHPAGYVAAVARRMAAEGHAPATTTLPSALTDDGLRRALRATRGNGIDHALIGEALGRDFPVAEVADLTRIESTEYLADLAARTARRTA